MLILSEKVEAGLANVFSVGTCKHVLYSEDFKVFYFSLMFYYLKFCSVCCVYHHILKNALEFKKCYVFEMSLRFIGIIYILWFT